jgi:hypothetical protein
MKKSLLAFVLLVSGFYYSNAQERKYILHPAVGDTIDKEEKKKFLLFPNIENKNFNYAYFTIAKGKHLATISLAGNDSLKMELSDSAIDQYYVNIEKLLIYYRSQESRDSLHSNDANTSQPGHDPEEMRLSKPIITPEIRDQINKDARVYRRLKDDEERMIRRQKGLDQTDFVIE